MGVKMNTLEINENPTEVEVELQEEFHAYRSGEYVGLMVASRTQMEEMGLTPGEKPTTDHPAILAQARAAASLTRREFCIWLDEAAVLDGDDVLSAAKGEWPVAMDAFLESLSPEGARRVKLEWAAATDIHRNNDFIDLLIWWLDLDPVAVDTAFGIEAGDA